MSFLHSTDLPTNTAVSMTLLIEEYIIDASASNLVYNLPAITCDGINFKLNRIDSKTTTVTVNALGLDTISSKTGIFNSNILLPNNTTIDIVSISKTWYILSKSQTSLAGTSQYCCNFMNNNGNNFINYGGGNNQQVTVAYIPFPGSLTGFSINSFTAVTSNFQFFLFSGHGVRLTNISNNAILTMSNNSTSSAPEFFIDTTANKSNIPTSISYLQVKAVLGSGNSYDLYSVIIN